VSAAVIRAEIAVTDEDFQRLLDVVRALSPAQRDALEAALGGWTSIATGAVSAAAPVQDDAAPISVPAPIAAIELRFAADPRCPACQSAEKIGKWGSANGLKRYRCKTCKVSFNCLTGTPLAQLHKRELWLGNASALVEGLSLRKTAARLGVHVETAFRWRHRFLKAPKTLKPNKLEGTVEADETYFLKSEKGSRKLTRPARKRGGKATKRGLSDEQVPVLIARDRTKATTDHILQDRSAKSIDAALGTVVDKQAILVSDGAQAYRAFANGANIVHVALNLSEGEHTWGVYHIQNVNNYCSRLKGWMRRFNGVATKYLDSYLGWHRLSDSGGDNFRANGLLAAAWG
jgi:transposase-like protein